jgi:UDP-2,3-diacylglucosamine hydrolase
MEITAPPRWHCVDFISDLHLHAHDDPTYQTWRAYLRDTAADAVFILGDLFEIWVGDDAIALQPTFEQRCVDELRAAARRLDLYIMRGNRDFLMGQRLMDACEATLLEDPSLLTFGGERWLLTHGDGWCLDDVGYMQFRKQVRSAQWQRDFLDKPLADRVEIARSMRAQSEARKKLDMAFVDIDIATANANMLATKSRFLIHGHTHRPSRQMLDNHHERLVLSDWDMQAEPARSEVLRLRSVIDHEKSTKFTVERIQPATDTVNSGL